ncbi:MAG: hypothetical protein ACLUD2_05420 [Clostridium sp.]
MIDYFEALSGAEQEQVSESIRLLYRQTFLLERTYDRKAKRSQTNPAFYDCNRHLEFIQKYFSIMGIEVVKQSAWPDHIRENARLWEKNSRNWLHSMF